MDADSIPLLASINLAVQFYPISTKAIIYLVCIVVLLAMSAFISGSEVAYFSLSPDEKNKLRADGDKHRVLGLLAKPERLLATILVANNFINIGIVVIFAQFSKMTMNFSDSEVLGFIIEVVVIGLLLLLFGEILPKVFASQHPLGFAMFMATPLRACIVLCSPLSSILISSTTFVKKGLNKYSSNEVTIDDISQAIGLASEEDIQEEKEMLEGIAKFGSKCASDIMTSRIDLLAVEHNSSFEKVLNIINDSGYSRIPIYAEKLDDMQGILYIKDLLKYTNEKDSFAWQKLIRPAFLIPESKKINDLLSEFQQNKIHLAIVVDEYGGVSGIVTLEDVLEEIVGDISDEFDDVSDKGYTKVNHNTYLFDGKTSILDFCKIFNIDEDIFDDISDEIETLAGLVLEVKEAFPKLNDKIKIKGFEMSVESIDKRRIKQLKVIIPESVLNAQK
ncbi:MAG: gliding motility-associated protein GldE [Bacteroidales bacterium]